MALKKSEKVEIIDLLKNTADSLLIIADSLEKYDEPRNNTKVETRPIDPELFSTSEQEELGPSAEYVETSFSEEIAPKSKWQNRFLPPHKRQKA